MICALRHGEIVGNCYSYAEGPKSLPSHWELGGILMAEVHRGSGLARAMTAFCAAWTLVSERPWTADRPVLAYVHEKNELPRRLLTVLGFERSPKQFTVSGDRAPASMPRNSRGEVVGDVFILRRDATPLLIDALERAFERGLELDLGPHYDANTFMTALRQT